MVRWYLNLRIRSKLLTVVGAVLVGAAGLGIMAERGLSKVNDQSVSITRDWLTGVEAIGEVARELGETHALQMTHISSISAEDLADANAKLQEQLGHVDRALDAYDKTIIIARDSALFKRLKLAVADHEAAWKPVQALSQANKNEDARRLLDKEVYPRYMKMDALLDSLVALNHDESVKATALAATIFERTKLMMGAIILALIALGVGLAWWAGTNIARQVATLVERMQSIQQNCIAGLSNALEGLASGDTTRQVRAVTEPIESTITDEIGDISRTFDRILTDTQAAITAMGTTQRSVQSVIEEGRVLIVAARDGNMSERVDANKHAGSFRDLVAGMNAMLQAVSVPIAEAQHVLAKVADKDLTARITGDYSGDYLALKTSVNTAIHNLSDTLEHVTAAAEQVAAASTQIAGSSQSLAGGASEQAASIEEIASSSTEFSSMARSTAANTQEAQALTQRARQNAVEGADRMQKLTEAVQEIRRGSQQTAKIVKTIEEIAFQTNLLALNAAVEAARAGDAGRGFAVVAEEVRALAIRSAEASKNTASLIEQALQSAEQGVALNAAAATSFDAIRNDVAKVADVVAEISAASQQQVEGVMQINGAIDQLNSATQQVASNAEESASTAEELSSQAAVLNSMVSAFILEHDAADVRAQAHAEFDRNHARQQRAVARRGATAAPVARAKAPRVTSWHAGADAEEDVLAIF